MPSDRSTPNESSNIEIPAEDWGAFLDAFSRQHEGWLVSIEISSPAAAQIEAKGRRLRGISIDHMGGRRSAYIETGDEQGSLLTHAVNRVVGVVFLRSKSGAHRGIEIFSADGTSTRVMFRSAVLPEMVDGLGAA